MLDGVYRTVRESLLVGLAIVLPVLLTVYLLQIAVATLGRLLVPLVGALRLLGVGGGVRALVLELASGVGLLFVVLLVGFLTHFSTGKRAVTHVDDAVRRLPGVGAVYGSLRRLSDAIVTGEADQFREVKLVEFPDSGSRMLGFVTNETPTALVGDEVAEDVVTLFVPLAPNPVMAGFLTTVDAEHVSDVDMSVEEGLSAVVSFGTTVSDDASGALAPAAN